MDEPADLLTPLDDYPIHQTSRPVAQPATGDPNHYDRFFFNGYDADGSLFFALAFGFYPNRDVVDAAFSVVLGGSDQVSVHVSGRCPLDRSAPSIGPIRIEIVRPMREHRLVVEAPEQGVRADLTMVAVTAPVQEPRFESLRGTRVVMDSTRLTQFGTWRGWLEVDGVRHDVAPEAVVGCRDRSWGVRGVGAPLPGPARLPQFYWLWAPVHLGDVCTHMDANEHADGTRWHESGFVLPVAPVGAPLEPATVATAMDYRLEWRPGTRRTAWAEIDLVHGGTLDTVRLEPLFEFQMVGLGYLNPEWGHGAWKGELEVGGSRLSLPVQDPLALTNLHVQALCRATMGDRVGVGVLEQLVIGPHQPSGLAGLNDGYQP